MGELHPTVTPGVVVGAARVVTPGMERDRGAHRGRSQGMDGIRELLEAARDGGLVTGHFRGLLHVVIGRRVSRPDGTVVSTGLTWREVAGLLKQLRFDKELVRELGADPDALAPRDRARFWYAAIAHAGVDSREAVTAAEKLVDPLKKLGFVVGPPPSILPPAPPATPPAAPPPPSTQAKAKKDEDKSGKRKKK